MGDRKHFFSGHRDLWHQFIYIDPPPPPPPPPPPLLVKHLQNLSVEKIVRVLAASVIRFNHSLLHGTCLACSTQLPCGRCFQYKQIFLLLCHCSCVAKQFARCVNEGVYAEPGRCLFWSTEEFFSKQLKSV